MSETSVAVPLRVDPASLGSISQPSTSSRFDVYFTLTVDITIATLALFFLWPLLALIALAIMLDSPGPALFKQTRRGLNGRPFTIYKFRTMTVLEDGPDVKQATRGDARVTQVGRWLRETSLDELPQLLNVLRGEMALVGPRPHALAHDEYYSSRIGSYNDRFRVRPGITGWAQVNDARGETPHLSDMQRRIEFDLWYVQNRNALLDLLILGRTIVIVARRTNAY